MKLSIEDSKKLLELGGVFFPDFEDDDDDAFSQTINLNDVWCWACADGEPVLDIELSEVAQLFRDYGFPGILYWVSEKHEQMRSEFEDTNRFIEFVRNEERIKKEEPDWNKRGYYKSSYILGVPKE